MALFNYCKKLASVKVKHTEEHVNPLHFYEKNVTICISLFSGNIALQNQKWFCCLLLPAGLLELRIHIWVTWGCTSLLLGVGKKTVLNRVHVNNDAGKMWYFA